jgi:glycosyltransferase involved in cell wall biosynthesis
MMKRRIGYLSGAPRVTTRPNGESGGARSHVLGVMGAYRQLGWEIKPFIYGDQIDLNSTSGSVIKGLLQGTTLGRGIADVGRAALGRRSAKRAVAEIGTDVDYVYERFSVFQSLGRGFKAAGIPWVLETQGLFYFEARHDRKSIELASLAKRLEIAAYRDCDVIVAVTDTLKDLLVSEAGIDGDKILVVPNGVDIEKFSPRPLPPDQARPRPVLGFVGGLLRWQGIDHLLKAVKAVQGKVPDFDVLVVGDGEERKNLEMLVRQLELADRVSFVGRVDGDEVPDWIQRFDLCFSGHLPSQLGGMYHSPLKIYEYMSMAKPVLASDFFDARSVIAGKGTGFLFESGNLESLSGRLIEAFSDRDALRAMGEKARDEVLANHSWRSRVDTMSGRIAQLLSSRSR